MAFLGVGPSLRLMRWFDRMPRVMSNNHLPRVLLVTTLIFPQLFCGTEQQQTRESAPRDAAIEEIISRGMELAESCEPKVTALLGQLAEEQQGELFGLEHRFKTPESLRRKLRELSQESSDPLSLSSIEDVLRYTIRIDDDPPGHYVQSVRQILLELERNGFTVLRVKNYWLPEDDYSGINTVLGNSDGLRWELQFHTSSSLAAKDGGHVLYERMRSIDTPVQEQRELFEELADRWEDVPLPSRVLEPQSLHELEVIERRSPPE